MDMKKNKYSEIDLYREIDAGTLRALIRRQRTTNRLKMWCPPYVDMTLHQKLYTIFNSHVFAGVWCGHLDIFMAESPYSTSSISSKNPFMGKMVLAFSYSRLKGQEYDGEIPMPSAPLLSGNAYSGKRESPNFDRTFSWHRLTERQDELLKMGKAYAANNERRRDNLKTWEYFRYFVWETFESSLTSEDRASFQMNEMGVVNGFYVILKKLYEMTGIIAIKYSALVDYFDSLQQAPGHQVSKSKRKPFPNLYIAGQDKLRYQIKMRIASSTERELITVSNLLAQLTLDLYEVLPIKFSRLLLENSPDVYLPWMRSATFGADPSNEKKLPIISYPLAASDDELGAFRKSVNFLAYKSYAASNDASVSSFGGIINTVSVPLTLCPPQSFGDCHLAIQAQIRFMNFFSYSKHGDGLVYGQKDHQELMKRVENISKLTDSIEKVLSLASWEHGNF